MINIKSKTHVFGALLGIFGGLQTFLPEVQQHIPAEYYGPALAIIGAIVIVLRNVTTVPVNQK